MRGKEASSDLRTKAGMPRTGSRSKLGAKVNMLWVVMGGYARDARKYCARINLSQVLPDFG
ncbi:hypothetical protein TomTYG45_01070 [Sphingobium sp. TomTYG45]